MSEELIIKKIYTDYPEVLDILLYDNTTKKILYGQPIIMLKRALGIL